MQASVGTSDSIGLTISTWTGTQGEGCSSGTPVLLFQLPTIEVLPFLPFFHLLTPRCISLDACMLSAKVAAPDAPCVGASAHQGGLNSGRHNPQHHPTSQIRTEASSLSAQSRLPSLLCAPRAAKAVRADEQRAPPRRCVSLWTPLAVSGFHQSSFYLLAPARQEHQTQTFNLPELRVSNSTEPRSILLHPGPGELTC